MKLTENESNGKLNENETKEKSRLPCDRERKRVVVAWTEVVMLVTEGWR